MRLPSPPYFALVTVVLFFGLLVWFDRPSAYTQADPLTLHQLTSQHTGVVSSHPAGFTELKGAVYFGVNSEKGGLWQTDGTEQGTVLVKDINLAPASLQRIGDLLYFVVYDDFYHAALWQSDGTAAGTIALRTDIDVYGTEFTAMGSVFYFAASTSTDGVELWQSDGTPEGTQIVADLTPGTESTYPNSFVVNNDLLYFVGYDEQGDAKLWQSDGTSEGTQVVAGSPIRPTSLTVMQNVLYLVGYNETYGDGLWRYGLEESEPTLLLNVTSDPWADTITNLTVVNERLFFAVSGHKLWQSDGTPAGTHILKDLASGPMRTYVVDLTAVDNLLYFTANVSGVGGEVWRSDGTPEGTLLVKALDPGAGNIYPGGLSAMNGQLYFLVAGSNSNVSLWKSDGTAAGTVALQAWMSAGFYGSVLTAIGSTLYFSADEGIHGAELWVSDGTQAGTIFIKDLDANYIGPQFGDVTRVQDRLYFTTFVGNWFYGGEEQLWMSSGATAPATLLDEQLGSYTLQGVGDTLFVSGYDATGPALWKHRGAAGGLELVYRFVKRSPSNLFVLNDLLFFVASDDTVSTYPHYALWRSDGTATGTGKVIQEVSQYYSPSLFARFNGFLFLGKGTELWHTDGTPEGTSAFIPAGVVGSIKSLVSTPTHLYIITYYEAYTDSGFVSKDEVWRSDGTLQGTQRLAAAEELNYIWELTSLGDALFFMATSKEHGRELWYNDGSSPTLVRATDRAPFPDYYTSLYTAADGQLFFTMDDGIHGPELWKSNGTPEGTALIKDIVPAELADTPSAYPGPLFAFHDLLFFGIHDGSHGQELWQSDGTTEGTVLFKDLNLGAGSSSPQNFVGHTDRFFFSANDGIHGRELWQSDGTAEGTTLVTDLYVGSASARPYSQRIFSDTLYFTADNGLDGRQLFALQASVPSAIPIEEEPLLPQQHQVYLPLVDQ